MSLKETVKETQIAVSACPCQDACILCLRSLSFVYFPVLFCLSVSVKWLAVKTASEMTWIVLGLLNC